MDGHEAAVNHRAAQGWGRAQAKPENMVADLSQPHGAGRWSKMRIQKKYEKNHTLFTPLFCKERGRTAYVGEILPGAS